MTAPPLLRVAAAACALAACRPARAPDGAADGRRADAPTVGQAARVAPQALAACAAGDTVLRRLGSLAQLRPPPAPFDSIWHDAGGRWACRLAAAGHLPPPFAPVDSVLAWLRAAGWSDRTAISADGPDGTVVGLVRGGVTCVVTGRWDGGDDTDPTYVPSDTIEVVLACVQALAGDTAGLPP